jgi:hypothetical protein
MGFGSVFGTERAVRIGGGENLEAHSDSLLDREIISVQLFSILDSTGAPGKTSSVHLSILCQI